MVSFLLVLKSQSTDPLLDVDFPFSVCYTSQCPMTSRLRPQFSRTIVVGVIWLLWSRFPCHDDDDDDFTCSGLHPRKRGVGLRDLPRWCRGDAVLHRDRLRHVQDRHQHTGDSLNEGSAIFKSYCRISWPHIRTSWLSTFLISWFSSGRHDFPLFV